MREFNRIDNSINEFYHEISLKQGLSDSAFDILQAILVLGNGCTQTDIYKYCVLNKQTVNSSVRRLKENGYITFSKGNGREIRIHMTPCGKALIKEKILPIAQAENEVFQEMTEEEQQEIIRLMNKYLDRFKEKVCMIMDGNK